MNDQVTAQDETQVTQVVDTADQVSGDEQNVAPVAEAEDDFEVNLPDDLSYDHLERIKQTATTAQRARLEKERAADVNTVKVLVAKHGLKWGDIKPEAGTRSATSKVAAKYRDPETGKEWSGRGKAPVWIRDHEDRTPFAIS